MRLRICLVIVLVGLMMASPATAQNRFGFFAGVNIASQTGDMETLGYQLADELEYQFGGTWDSENSSTTGFGAGISYFIETSKTFGAQLEVQYIQRGSKIQNSGQDLTLPGAPSSLAVTTRFQVNYFEVPLLARYSPSPEAKVRAVFLGGPVIGAKTGASVDVEVQGSSISQDSSSGYQSASLGMIFGVGMDVRAGQSTHFLLQARYYLGLLNTISDPTLEAKSSDLGFFAGFEYPIGPKGSGAKETP